MSPTIISFTVEGELSAARAEDANNLPIIANVMNSRRDCIETPFVIRLISEAVIIVIV
jgi:hypothetical protein